MKCVRQEMRETDVNVEELNRGDWKTKIQNKLGYGQERQSLF